MTESRPDPLVPKDVDLRHLPFMSLDVARLMESETWIIAADVPFMGHALISLWCAAWHEVPAGSLPANPRILARKAHRSLEQLEELIAQGLMQGWVLCSDGRFYHPVVCEKALEAWNRTMAYRRGAKVGAAASVASRRAKAKQTANEPPTDPERTVEKPQTEPERTADDLPTDRSEPASEQATDSQQEGEGEGQGEGKDPPIPPEGDSPVARLTAKRVARKKLRRLAVSGEGDMTPGFAAFWSAYPKKVKKQDAMLAWERDPDLEEYASTLVRDVQDRLKADDRWRRGFIPDPTTYLNQRRWTDDIVRGPDRGDRGSVQEQNEDTAADWAEGGTHG